MTPPQAILRLEGLNVDLPTADGPLRPVENLDLEISRGERLGLVGESGCGKSMTALAILRLLPAGARTGGRILFDGRDLTETSEDALCRLRGRRISMVFQEPMTALNPVRTIGEQVAEGPQQHLGLGRREALSRAEELLDRFGLPRTYFPSGLYPHQLSGGQRQRVCLAMALACDPDLLIADEPTMALDVSVQAQILDLLVELAEERGMALLLITHDLGLVAQTVERTAVMYAGRVVEEAPTSALFERRAHPYTRGLLEAIPRLDHGEEDGLVNAAPRLVPIPGEVPDLSNVPVGCGFAPRCSWADNRCTETPPPLTAHEPGHKIACFHPLAVEPR
jgi:peptide/nickel transport system ATP-binding protein